MLFEEQQHTLPFRKWLWKEKENRLLIIIAFIVCIIQFSWFKYLYPYPNFIDESSRYIEIAQKNLWIGYLPIGYSKFLRLVSSFNSSHLLLIVVQYFALQAAILYLAFSVKYLLGAGKWVTRIFILLCVGNPLLLHLANMVSADAWFTAVSLVWITQLLWFIRKSTAKLLIWHILVLLLAFITSHQAVYYPFISVLVVIFVEWRTWAKVAGIGAMTLLLLGFIGGTQYEYKKLTGRVQYSAMHNWEKAANAIYWYAKDSLIPEQKMTGQYRKLHAWVNHYLDSVTINPKRKSAAPPYYLWNEVSPLITYAQQQKDTSGMLFGFTQWASIAPYYARYGKRLTELNNESFPQQYLKDNLVKFYIPDPEAMIKYNLVNDTIEKQSAAWFGIKSKRLSNRYHNNWMLLPRYFPPLTTMLNIVFTSCLLAILIYKKYQFNPYSRRALILSVTCLTFNFFFSIFLSYVTLRHQTFAFIVTLIINLLGIQFLLQYSFTNKKRAHDSSLSTSPSDLNTLVS